MITDTCCICFMEFGVTEAFNQACRRDGRWYHCPQGHRQQYSDNETDRLRRERDQLKQQMARKDDDVKHFREWAERAEDRATTAERRRRAAAGQVTKLKNRAVEGKCPCCDRTLRNLAKHMAEKHPGFVAEAVDDEAPPLPNQDGG